MSIRSLFKSIRTADILLAGLFLLIALGFLLWSLARFGTAEGACAEIRCGGELYGTYPLQEELTLELCSDSGIHNTVRISGGAVWVEDADCPDRYCVRHDPVSRCNETIICLPAALVITVLGAEEDESGVSLDAVAR